MSPIRPDHADIFGGLLQTGPDAFIWGGGGELIGPSVTYVNVQVGPEGYGPWTITFAALKATGNSTPGAGVAPVPANYPLDNQVLTSTLARTLMLSWGAGGASEQVLLDYPFAGATLTVHGGQVTLQTIDRGANAVLPAPPFVRPIGGAWITPGARACTYQWTSSVLVPAAANVASYVPVPRRAVSYQLVAAAAAVADTRTLAVLVQQIDTALNTSVSLDRSAAAGFYASASTPVGAWTRLVPNATSLQLGATGLGLGLDRDVRVTFALDFG